MEKISPKRNRLLLEVIASEDGKLTLAETGFPVRIKTLIGQPKNVEVSDYNNSTSGDTNVFGSFSQRIYEVAPPRANAYILSRNLVEEDMNVTDDGVFHRLPVQYLELNKDSVKEALEFSGLL